MVNMDKPFSQHTYDHLKELLSKDIIGDVAKFTWGRILRRYFRNHNVRYIFWWRVASYLHHSKSTWKRKLANKINRKITHRYGAEIELGAVIDTGITFAHYQGIVISRCAVIGKNFHIRQNTTIGVRDNQTYQIKIGDNVEVGANSCIIGGNIRLGNNVKIGAMTFINKDIPDNSICYNKRELFIKNSASD